MAPAPTNSIYTNKNATHNVQKALLIKTTYVKIVPQTVNPALPPTTVSNALRLLELTNKIYPSAFNVKANALHANMVQTTPPA